MNDVVCVSSTGAVMEPLANMGPSPHHPQEMHPHAQQLPHHTSAGERKSGQTKATQQIEQMQEETDAKLQAMQVKNAFKP